MKWTEDDIKFVEKAIEIRNKGLYVDSRQLVERYNKILERNRGYTSCGSCLRQMVGELENALIKFKKQMELSGMTSTNELINEINAINEELKETKPKGRKKKE